MPAMRAPFSFRSRSIACSRSFESITSSRKVGEPLAHRVAARLGGEHLLDAGLHGVRALARGIDPDRAAMAGDRPRMEHFQPVHLQQVLRLPSE